MAIVSSVLVENRVQVDGRLMRHEQHMDADGSVLDVFYVGDAGSDGNAIMLDRVPVLNQQMADAEMAANLAEALA